MVVVKMGWGVAYQYINKYTESTNQLSTTSIIGLSKITSNTYVTIHYTAINPHKLSTMCIIQHLLITIAT